MRGSTAAAVRGWALSFAVGLLLVAPVRADLAKAQAEPNLEKRAKLALDNANSAWKNLKDAYKKGDNADVARHAREVLDSVELADTSLKQTGKNPRRSPKHFKNAEIATRNLLRNLDSFQESMSYDDRSMLDQLKNRVQEIHDSLLMGLMEGKK